MGRRLRCTTCWKLLDSEAPPAKVGPSLRLSLPGRWSLEGDGAEKASLQVQGPKEPLDQ